MGPDRSRWGEPKRRDWSHSFDDGIQTQASPSEESSRSSSSFDDSVTTSPAQRCCTTSNVRKQVAWGLLIMGVACATLATTIHLMFPRIVARRVSSLLVVSSMEDAHKSKGWFNNTDKRTKTYLSIAYNPTPLTWMGSGIFFLVVMQSYWFYNISNPAYVKQGALPEMNMIGPYTFKIFRAKHNVSFSHDGLFVDYTENVEAVFVPEKSDGFLDDTAIVLNLAYITGVSKKRSEKNMLLQGVRAPMNKLKKTQLADMKKNLAAFVMGGWGTRQGDLAYAMNVAAAAVGEAEAYRRWGAEGLGSAQELLNLPEDDLDLAYWDKLLNPHQDLAPETVAKLMNPANPNGLTFINQPDVPLGGFAQWATGKLNQPVVDDGLGVEKPTRVGLTLWAWGMVESPLAHDRALRVYQDLLTPENQATSLVKTIDDLTLRQFYAADVLSTLAGLPVDHVVGIPVNDGAITYATGGDPDTAPLIELGYYLRAVEKKTMDDINRDWSPDQGYCALDVVASNKTYYEYRVLGIPSPYYQDDYANENARINLPIKQPLDECMDIATNFNSYYDYLLYVAETSVKPLFQAFVVNNKGSLFESRTVKEMILGHKEPLLSVSLPLDNPSARLFALMPNNSLNAPPFCESSGDVEDFKTACKDLGYTLNGNRVFGKVPNRYHTGKGDVSRLGQLELYHGHSQAEGTWGGKINVTGGARDLPGSVQFGFSNGIQFPPLDAIKKADSLYAMRAKGPVVLKLDKVGDHEVEGVKLIKFGVSPDIFTTTPNAVHPIIDLPDKERVTLDVDPTGKYLNASYTGSPVYFSGVNFVAPHYPRKPESLTPGTSGPSYFAVEPTTGMTMEWALELQVSVSLTDYACGDLDIFHQGVPRLPIFPVSVIRSFGRLHPGDAQEFRNKVYHPQARVKTVVRAMWVGSGLMALIGLLMVTLLSRRRRVMRKTGSSVELTHCEGNEDDEV